MTRKEEIEKASVDYQMSKHPMAIGGDGFADTIYKVNINPSFIAGAEWADQHPREGFWNSKKVIEWIALHAELYGGFNQCKLNSMCEDLIKAMEE